MLGRAGGAERLGEVGLPIDRDDARRAGFQETENHGATDPGAGARDHDRLPFKR
jgi:hypothetical protein